MALSSSLYGAHRTALTLQRGPGRQNQHNRGLAQYEVAEEASADGRGFQGLQALLDAIRTISERAYPPPSPTLAFASLPVWASLTCDRLLPGSCARPLHLQTAVQRARDLPSLPNEPTVRQRQRMLC